MVTTKKIAAPAIGTVPLSARSSRSPRLVTATRSSSGHPSRSSMGAGRSNATGHRYPAAAGMPRPISGAAPHAPHDQRMDARIPAASLDVAKENLMSMTGATATENPTTPQTTHVTSDPAMGRRLKELWALIGLPFALSSVMIPFGLLPHAVFHPVYILCALGAILALGRLRSATGVRSVRRLAFALIVAQAAAIAARVGEDIAVFQHGGLEGSVQRDVPTVAPPAERQRIHASGSAGEPDPADRPHDHVRTGHAGRATFRRSRVSPLRPAGTRCAAGPSRGR